MLKIIKKENIMQDTIITAQVKGKLIKLYFNNKYPNVMVQVENQDHEVIWQGNLDQEHLNIYPRKMINILDETKLENFYLYPNQLDQNNLFLRITGLQEGQSIGMVKVLYEDKGIVRTTD